MPAKHAKLSLHITIRASLVRLVLVTNKERHILQAVHSFLRLRHSQHLFVRLITVRRWKTRSQWWVLTVAKNYLSCSYLDRVALSSGSRNLTTQERRPQILQECLELEWHDCTYSDRVCHCFQCSSRSFGSSCNSETSRLRCKLFATLESLWLAAPIRVNCLLHQAYVV